MDEHTVHTVHTVHAQPCICLKAARQTETDEQTGSRNEHTVKTGHNGGLTAFTGKVIWTPDEGKREGVWGRDRGDRYMRKKRERDERRAERHAVRTTDSNPCHTELFHLIMSSPFVMSQDP